MKYRSSMERCPVGGLTMMTSFLAALTMTSSFGPKSRTSTGWSNMALVSTSFLLASISRWCLAWRTSTARSSTSNVLIFGCDDHNNSTTRVSQVFTAWNQLWLKRTMPSWESYRVSTFFFLILSTFSWWFSAWWQHLAGIAFACLAKKKCADLAPTEEFLVAYWATEGEREMIAAVLLFLKKLSI